MSRRFKSNKQSIYYRFDKQERLVTLVLQTVDLKLILRKEGGPGTWHRLRVGLSLTVEEDSIRPKVTVRD